MTEGHEALAIFTSAETAAAYESELSDSAGWTAFQPTREKFIDVLQASRQAGLLYAALDPVGGVAKTLFDIPRVLAAALNSGG